MDFLNDLDIFKILVLSGIMLFIIGAVALITQIVRQRRLLLPVAGMVLGISAVVFAWGLSQLGVISGTQSTGIPTYEVGETWTVDGEWSITVTDVYETDYRNDYSDVKPNHVYVIEYQYTNIGYGHDPMDVLSFYLDEYVRDSKGKVGEYYSGTVRAYPTSTPQGATCRAQVMVGLKNAGPFTAVISKYDFSGGLHEAQFYLDPNAPAADPGFPEYSGAPEGLGVGETWTVDGLWELTITGVRKTDERDPFVPDDPEAVYIIDYTYTNIGYKDSDMGLYLSIDNTVVDSHGVMGYSYIGGVDRYPTFIKVGESFDAQACVGLAHDGPFSIYMYEYSGGEYYQQVFTVDPEA